MGRDFLHALNHNTGFHAKNMWDDLDEKSTGDAFLFHLFGWKVTSSVLKDAFFLCPTTLFSLTFLGQL